VAWHGIGKAKTNNEILRQQLEIGKIIGRETRAKEVLAHQAQLLETTRKLTKGSTLPLLSAVAWAQGFTVQTTGVFTGEIFERLGRGNYGQFIDNLFSIARVSLEMAKVGCWVDIFFTKPIQFNSDINSRN
jgi:ABC-type Fe3+-hydroxamate transport system substrate-binding protein